MRKSKVILDTILWVSYLISKNSVLDFLITTEAMTLIFSEESLQEFVDVIQRPKFKEYFGKKEIHALLRTFNEFGEMYEVSSEIDLCRDSKDNFLLALAVDSSADYLVTGDNDLLVLDSVEQTEIKSMKDFLNEMSILYKIGYKT